MKRENFTNSILFLMLCFLVFSVSSGKAEQTTIKSPMPTPRMAAACAVADGKIYILGGIAREGRATSVVDEYNPATDKWTKKASMLTPRVMASAVTVNEKIYVLGGRGERGVLNVVERYDPAGDSWKRTKRMPLSLWNHMVAGLSGEIYVIGGITGVGGKRESLDKVKIYNIEKDSWRGGSPMPMSKQGASVAVVQGKIYIIGGRAGAGDAGYATDSVEAYDLLKKAWSQKKSMQKARTGAQATVVGGRTYVVGGAAQDKATKSIDMYDPSADAWKQIGFMQKPRTGHCVASVGNKLYIIGGATEQSLAGITGMVEELTIGKTN